MRTFAIIAGVLAAGLALFGPLNARGVAAGTLEGVVRVVDADTLRVGQETVRLLGIDAIETAQRCGGNGTPMWDCGGWLTREVAARFDGRHAVCSTQDRDRYDRVLASCAIDGRDLGALLLSEGLVFTYRESTARYRALEAGARAAERGLQAAGAERPHRFRSAAREGHAAQRRADAAVLERCKIKGNINRDGKKIYHMPGQRHYAETVIRLDRREKYFCSEAEAKAAGWRKAMH